MTKSEVVELLSIPNFSSEYYDLLKKADMITRNEFKTRAYIFAQIGIDSNPCPGNCKFCSLASNNFAISDIYEKSCSQVLVEAKLLIKENIDDLFLMTTAGYPVEKFIEIGSEVARILPSGMRLVANVGDFSLETAFKLKGAGFTGAYHIRRLREGIDTDIKPETRIATIENIKNAGLELYYCIEPIGPEHTYEEIAEEILFARDLFVGAMAVMRRIAVPGTRLYNFGQISKAEILKIGAVTRIVTEPTRSMNIHETVESSLLCGVNQLYAEYGVNPRDTVEDTSCHRGYTVSAIRDIFSEYEYQYK